jgi:hypothetical protein
VLLNVSVRVIGHLLRQLAHFLDLMNLGFFEKLMVLQKESLDSTLNHLMHIDWLICVIS